LHGGEEALLLGLVDDAIGKLFELGNVLLAGEGAGAQRGGCPRPNEQEV